MKWERGNYVPRPGDRNNDPNPTRDGIIQRTYDKYRLNKRLPRRSVFDAPLAEWLMEWEEIFRQMFWGPAGCDTLPEPLDLICADAAFNSGPKQAVKFLQRACGAVPDGIFGKETETKMRQRDARELCISVIGQRIRFLRALHQRSLELQAEWDATPEHLRSGDRPEEFPVKGLLNRVSDLQRTAGV